MHLEYIKINNISKMRSRLRSATKISSKQRKLQVTKVYYPSPHNKQFIAYSAVSKQSNSGMSSHQRFLLFDSFSKSLRYYSKTPQQLPLPGQELSQGKQIIYLKKVKNFEFKAVKNNVGKAIVSWSDLNGVRKNWSLTFSSNQLMNDWVIVVNQAKQDGHLKPDDRPVAKKQSKIRNTEKYETEFIKTTGGIMSRKSSSLQKSQNQSVLVSSGINNSDWITKIAMQKERQLQQNRKQLHQLQISQPKNQEKRQSPNLNDIKKQDKNAPPLFNRPPLIAQVEKNNVRQNRISVIPEVEDQSKMSKKEYKELQSQSTKNFRIDRTLPLPIQEIEQSIDQTQSNSKKIGSQLIGLLQLTGQKIEELPKKQNNLEVKQNKYEINELQIKHKLNMLIKQGEQKEKSKKNGVQETNFVSEEKFYPWIYWNFVQKCEQLGILIIQNLPMLLKTAVERPSKSCQIDEENNMIIIKDGIQFKYRLEDQQQAGDDIWSCNSLKTQHYSSMVEYISRLSRSTPISYTTVLPIPCCVLNYKWKQLQCKAIIPPQFVSVDSAEEQRLNTLFEMPTGSWQYYSLKQILLVDYAIDNLIISSDPDQDTVFEACQDMCKEETHIEHIKDLLLYCRWKFCLSVDSALVIRMMQRIGQDSNKHIFTILLSILFGIKSAKYIRIELSDKMHTLDAAEMYQHIDAYIKAFTIDHKCSISNRIMSLITCELQAKNIYIKKVVPDVHSVFSTIVFVLGLELYKNGRALENKHCIRFVPIVHTLSAEGLSDQMAKLDAILKDSQSKSWGQQRKFQSYEQVTKLLQEFNSKWENSQESLKTKQIKKLPVQEYSSAYYTNPNNIRGNKSNEQGRTRKWANKGKYLNNYYRIMHFKSLYQPYLLDQVDPTYIYSSQLQSIFNEEPPFYFSYLIGINCIKWTSKRGTSHHDFVIKMLHDQIQNCREWSGQYSSSLLSYYQLYATYAQQIFDLHSAVENARHALQLVIQIYGDDSAESAQKWFLLANILVEGELYEQALQAYLKSLQVLKQSETNNGMLSRTITSSRTTLLSWRMNTAQAQFTIHMKLIKIYLSLGDTKNCLAQCSLCHRAMQQFADSRPTEELEILNTIVRCYQLTQQFHKLLLIVQVISIQFGNRIIQMKSSLSNLSIQFQESLRESMLKICLAPSIQLKIKDSNRKNFLFNITRAIRSKYQDRFTKKQYNQFLTTISCQQRTQNQRKLRQNEGNQKVFNMIDWFMTVFQALPILSSNQKGHNQYLDINYSLHESAIGSKIHAVTQPKLLLTAMRIIQALSGIIGPAYLSQCFCV